MLDLDANYEVLNFIVGDTKAGTKMGKMQLRNVDDMSVLNCILWEETLNRLEEKLFKTGNIIKIVTASYNEKFNNCLINNMKLVEEALCGLDEAQREQKYEALISFVQTFKNEKLRDFVLQNLQKDKQALLVAPAAKAMHHNYIGGLLVHTLECLDFAKIIYPKLNNRVDEEELYAACILHDIGKIFEYKINTETGFIDYSEEFKKDWISHSQYGYTLCMNEGFKNIAKMIAAHHGRSDWGAMIDLSERDLEPFYYIVHHIDDLSAKFGKTNVRDLKTTEE
ncbi:TPA: HD domain-containing protein [Candidatus Galligastranaerophilus intestinavium]|uniref:HD domain-containing protein n=1 Tax=Candidatus Galligastranaerophilus intestinavium TaxID=2840836 RepID=A0A9D1FJ61_9BACT|nr:HD domain-containing protein [Candidatus Galligastranaerophilus intestinavium]